jgi:O-antigen biosynthesis protein
MQQAFLDDTGMPPAQAEAIGPLMNLHTSALLEPSRLVFPPPWIGHIPFASWLVALLRPRLLVELGTHSGNSYCAFCQAMVESAVQGKAFAVDTWCGDEHSFEYEEDVFHDLSAHHDPRYGSFSTLLRTTFDEAVHRFDDGSVDVLHIDGLHT